MSIIRKISFALRFLAALLYVTFCHINGIPVGVSGKKAMDAAVERAAAWSRTADSKGRVRAARRRGLNDGDINLSVRRSWAMPVSTVTSLNGLFNKIYEDSIFVARDSNLMAGLVTGYKGTGYADRTIPIYPSLVATSVGEGVDYANAVEWTETAKLTMSVGEIMSQVILTDRRIQTDPGDARRDAAVEMGGAIATKIDVDLVGLFNSFTVDKGTAVAGSVLTINRAAAALAKLRNNKAKGPFSFVVHPYSWHAIWKLLGQPVANQTFLGDSANQALRDYFMGPFVGGNWYTEANIPISAGTISVSAVFNREALALDTRQAPTMEPERDASKRAWELNMRAGYAVGLRRDEFGVKLSADAAEPT